MDACDQVHSEGISLRTTVMPQQSEITELQAADRRRQAVITDLLKADYRRQRQRQRQLVETLKIVKSLKAQMIELQRQQGPAKDPAEPELPEEADLFVHVSATLYSLLSITSISRLKIAPRGRPTRLNPDATPTPVTDTHTTISVTNTQIQAMINEGVDAALAARDATRNGDDSHTSGTGARRPVQVARECTYPDFLKCQPLNFKGTEGVVGLTDKYG
ncbi:hypothetical protein Tco_1432005 [Tanacetum coccineum]